MQRTALICTARIGARGLRVAARSPPRPSKPARPPHEYWTWGDPGIAQGNFDADYADCKSQVESDPAITASTPKLAVVSAYLKCMQPKGWKFVNPDAAAAVGPRPAARAPQPLRSPSDPHRRVSDERSSARADPARLRRGRAPSLRARRGGARADRLRGRRGRRRLARRDGERRAQPGCDRSAPPVQSGLRGRAPDRLQVRARAAARRCSCRWTPTASTIPARSAA